MGESAIYYFHGDEMPNASLKPFFRKFDIELDYEVLFNRLMSKINYNRPAFLVIDGKSTGWDMSTLSAFSIESPLYVPGVAVIVERNAENLKSRYPNIFYINESELEEKIPDIVVNCIKENTILKMSDRNHNYSDEILSILVKMEFNAKSKGSAFLGECIQRMLVNGSKSLNLTKLVYTPVALKNNTTLTNIDRAMRTAISKAWTNWDAQSLAEEFGVDKEYFSKKPTVKELICFVARHILNMERKVKSMNVMHAAQL